MSPLVAFGGTFDPVHIGHLVSAREVAEALEAEVHLLPANVPPHRPQPVASAADRLDLLAVALAGELRLVVDDLELRREGPSYSVDTLAVLRARCGAERPLVLAVGADAFAGFATWHRWRDIFGIAHVLVLTRPGSAAPPAGALAEELARRRAEPAALRAYPAGRIAALPVTPIGVSATAVRAALAAGRPPRWLVPDAVLARIAERGLYR